MFCDTPEKPAGRRIQICPNQEVGDDFGIVLTVSVFRASYTPDTHPSGPTHMGDVHPERGCSDKGVSTDTNTDNNVDN